MLVVARRGMRGYRRGACMAVEGACMVAGGLRGIRRDTVNERAVRILLECILVERKGRQYRYQGVKNFTSLTRYAVYAR